MKRSVLSVILAGAVAWVGYGQDNSTRAVRQVAPGVRAPQQESGELPRFDLDFPGGTPQQLVDSIRKEIGTLNAIIPNEHKDLALPPLKMRGVNVKQLFEALELASQKAVPYQHGVGPGGQALVSSTSSTMGFRATGPVTPESVWYLFVAKPHVLEYPKVVRYYQLSPYLMEYKIDDITTAIQAGWKMLEEPETPKLNFHEDTRLLIAVGQLSQLNMIDSVLSELNKGLSPENRERVRITGKPDANPR